MGVKARVDIFGMLAFVVAKSDGLSLGGVSPEGKGAPRVQATRGGFSERRVTNGRGEGLRTGMDILKFGFPGTTSFTRCARGVAMLGSTAL